ncbi:SWEET sugar transporter [Artemisia annua]|uniref:Bidirectional sugar transporter SWEET n=1 Tax=Artemisia annua TaxID=35608 RepID=A0A2U1M1J3_ARTAN|nr:SWEET sugar transporter [Artemisia annua]
MVTADFVVGILGNVISILSFTSPIPQFRHIVKGKSAENYNGTPYVATLLSCSLWILYGLLDPDDGVLIVTVNAAGVSMQTLYLIILFIYSSKEKRVKYFGFVILDILFLGMVLAFTLVAFKEGRRTFTGVLCATFTTMMYAAPLAALSTTIKTKSVEYMPILLVFFLFLNGCAWFTFALLVTDIFVMVPNALGILLGAIQFTVYLIYRNATPTVMSELEKGTLEKQIESRGIDIQDINVNANSVSSKKRTLSRVDAFSITRSPPLSPNKSDPIQQHGDDAEDSGVN